jgi:hypothetical protein
VTDRHYKQLWGENKTRVILGEEEETVIRRNEQTDVINSGDAVLSGRKFSDFVPSLWLKCLAT